MQKVAVVSALGAVIGYAAVYFAFFAQPKPVVVAEEAAAQESAEPAVLANVVEMVDTEPLLEARPKKSEGEPFEAVVPAYFTEPEALPIAPAPHEPGAAPGHTSWYGPNRLPKQIGGEADPETLVREFREWLARSQSVYMPSGVSYGVGCYF